jgi:hypothetical protein
MIHPSFRPNVDLTIYPVSVLALLRNIDIDGVDHSFIFPMRGGFDDEVTVSESGWTSWSGDMRGGKVSWGSRWSLLVEGTWFGLERVGRGNWEA